MPFDAAGFSQPQTDASNLAFLQRMRSLFRKELLFPSERESDTVILLRRSKNLITKEKHWTTGQLHNRSRTQFCAIGALAEASFRSRASSETKLRCHEILSGVAMHLGFPSVENLNDRQGHAAVLMVYDEAIRVAKQEG